LGIDLFFAGDFGDVDAVSGGERLGELVLKNTATGGVRSWFEESPEASAWIFSPEGCDRFSEGGWVVTEIIYEGDSVRFCADF
jgi:hypothetical protein